jgi:hypothetical protein
MCLKILVVTGSTLSLEITHATCTVPFARGWVLRILLLYQLQNKKRLGNIAATKAEIVPSLILLNL